MQLKNECEGCKSYSDKKAKGTCLAAITPRLSDTIRCPCVLCLVKGMCVKPCKEFKVYGDKVYRHYGVERYEIKRSL